MVNSQKFHMNKQAQIFDILSVFVILFFAFIGITVTLTRDQPLANAAINPVEVLKIVDEKQAFEINEKIILKEIYCNVGISDTQQKSDFCNKLQPYSKFLTQDLYYQGQYQSETLWEVPENWNNFCKQIYTIKSDGTSITLIRTKSHKIKELSSISSTDKNAFNITLNMDLSDTRTFQLDEFCS